MTLTPEEQQILDGKQGAVLAKVMETLVLYGEAFGATEFVPVNGKGHLVTSFGISVLKPVFSIMDELITAGLRAEGTFTMDPRPLDYDNVPCSFLEKFVFNRVLYGMQRPYEQQLRQLGLQSDQAFSCTCYLDEVGNIPQKGDVLSWAESSAVVYANSVLGARCNRNSGILELFGSILGKVPKFDLLTDEGRRASWVVEIRTSQVPEAQILGSAVGQKVMEAVPYIKGLDIFLGTELNDNAKAYLKDMGAATASNGAVGLYHVANLTPEAAALGEDLILPDARVYVIDDAELARVREGYPNIWKNPNAQPERCFLGCPHLSFAQLEEWETRLSEELRRQGKQKLGLLTILSAAPEVLAHYRAASPDSCARLTGMGAHLTSICPLMYMNNPLCGKKPVITNSNKLRTYTAARYFTDGEITRIAVKGAF
jgi:predicted aconitase